MLWCQINGSVKYFNVIWTCQKREDVPIMVTLEANSYGSTTDIIHKKIKCTISCISIGYITFKPLHACVYTWALDL